MKKILLSIGIGILALLIVSSVAAGIFISPIVKVGMETIGPKIIQVPIKVDAVGLSLLTGSAQLKGLIVGNPEGYKTPEAIKLKVASVSLDPFSVLSNKIVIRSIHVKSPEITFEGGLGGSNLTKIMDNVNAIAKAEGPQTSKDSNKPAPKIQIDDFLITGAKVHISFKGLSGKDMTVPLPDIHLTNLGKDSDGLTPTQLISTVLGSITKATVKAVTQVVSGSTKVIKDIGKDVGKEASSAVKSVTKNISGLFGK